MNPGQDRQPLAPLQDPPVDDMRVMIEQAIEDINSATQYHDPNTVLGTNLLEAMVHANTWYQFLSIIKC